MKHACQPIPMEEQAIPHEVRAEAMASKGRVRARLEEVMDRIRERETLMSMQDELEVPSETEAEQIPEPQIFGFDEEIDSAAITD